MIVGLVTIALSMVLVGRSIMARRRAGEPVARNALIWAAIVAIGFAIALTIDRHAG